MSPLPSVTVEIAYAQAEKALDPMLFQCHWSL